MDAADASHHNCEAPARTTASLHISQLVTNNGVRNPQVPTGGAPKRDGAPPSSGSRPTYQGRHSSPQ
ncbi:hypothetical protein NDU88_005217 [Pleurodeles waltl]|uniref:Uncharacterized protein n=1 Tax=Pleurodeles waltl TaxID=8319 RepID=A0AAV7NM33_PLEWA|nr:hypothetical protein NDU88_005217 [Pleurodeles waltl]